MTPSKENCKEALNALSELSLLSQGTGSNQISFIREFLEAAAKRLPTQAAIDKDKVRKKSKASA